RAARVIGECGPAGPPLPHPPIRCPARNAHHLSGELRHYRFTSEESSATVPCGMIDTVRSWVDGAKRLVVLTGAGISTDSGIPDFRGPQGVWTRNPEAEKLATLQNYLADPEVRKRSWQSRLESPAWQAKPNAGHRALVVLERRGLLDTLIT